tara:strand:- start:682 stop:2910 length:2229 start_codon:yes stop_codon:yes gene_type:complete
MEHNPYTGHITVTQKIISEAIVADKPAGPTLVVNILNDTPGDGYKQGVYTGLSQEPHLCRASNLYPFLQAIEKDILPSDGLDTLKGREVNGILSHSVTFFRETNHSDGPEDKTRYLTLRDVSEEPVVCDVLSVKPVVIDDSSHMLVRPPPMLVGGTPSPNPDENMSGDGSGKLANKSLINFEESGKFSNTFSLEDNLEKGDERGVDTIRDAKIDYILEKRKGEVDTLRNEIMETEERYNLIYLIEEKRENTWESGRRDKLRAVLEALSVPQLHERAIEEGATEAEIANAKDSATNSEEEALNLRDLIEEKRENMWGLGLRDKLRAVLEALSVPRLRERALEEGATETEIANAKDSAKDSEEEAVNLIHLIEERGGVGRRDKLRMVLEKLPVQQLRKRALKEGVTKAEIAKAKDSAKDSAAQKTPGDIARMILVNDLSTIVTVRHIDEELFTLIYSKVKLILDTCDRYNTIYLNLLGSIPDEYLEYNGITRNFTHYMIALISYVIQTEYPQYGGKTFILSNPDTPYTAYVPDVPLPQTEDSVPAPEILPRTGDDTPYDSDDVDLFEDAKASFEDAQQADPSPAPEILPRTGDDTPYESEDDESFADVQEREPRIPVPITQMSEADLIKLATYRGIAGDILSTLDGIRINLFDLRNVIVKILPTIEAYQQLADMGEAGRQQRLDVIVNSIKPNQETLRKYVNMETSQGQGLDEQSIKVLFTTIVNQSYGALKRATRVTGPYSIG